MCSVYSDFWQLYWTVVITEEALMKFHFTEPFFFSALFFQVWIQDVGFEFETVVKVPVK